MGIAAGAGVGATLGGLAAKMRDGGFPDGRLRQVGEALKPGTSALVAVIDHTWVAEAERQLQQAGADTVTEALSADIARQLEAGKDVAYSAVSTSEGVGITRVEAGGEAEEPPAPEAAVAETPAPAVAPAPAKAAAPASTEAAPPAADEAK